MGIHGNIFKKFVWNSHGTLLGSAVINGMVLKILMTNLMKDKSFSEGYTAPKL